MVAKSTGSLPPFIDIYRWNGTQFEGASVRDTLDNNYARLYNEQGRFIIESGNWKDSKTNDIHYYRFEDGKLIEMVKEE